LARKLAAYFDFAYLDTGALYRAVAVSIMAAGGAVDNEADAVPAAKRFDMAQLADSDFAARLRTAETGRAASVVAAMPDVRAAIILAQRQFADTPTDAISARIYVPMPSPNYSSPRALIFAPKGDGRN
jgi:cytidylate kinase